MRRRTQMKRKAMIPNRELPSRVRTAREMNPQERTVRMKVRSQKMVPQGSRPKVKMNPLPVIRVRIFRVNLKIKHRLNR